jgi:hypothetical protein
MELSEAKERISQLIAYGEMLIEGTDENDCENTKKTFEAWNIIKKALEDSLPKEKVRKKIEELELLKKALPIRTEIPRFIDYLKELLGE